MSVRDTPSAPMSNPLNTPTPQELADARALKAEALLQNHLLSDFEYLQHAIIAKSNMSKALTRIANLKKFRLEYNIQGVELDDPLSLYTRYRHEFRSIISVGKDRQGRSCQLSEYKSFVPSALTGEHWRVMMILFYYLFQAMNSDLDSIRKGITFIADCQGVSWANFSFELEKRAASFYHDAYPIRMSSIVMMDAPKIVR